jgi:hypothetical protein
VALKLITINAADVEHVAQSLVKLTGQSLGEASVSAVNKVTQRTFDTARQLMIENINLTEGYVSSQMSVRLATDPRDPKATITANRRGVRGTTLASYGAQVVMADVNWKNEEIIARGHKFGKWPGWTKRKGNPALGIPENMKAAGFTVSVKRGEARRFQRSASGNHYSFLIPVGGRLMPVTRLKGKRGKGSLEVLRGPSPWQLFRSVIPRMRSDIEQDLQKTLINEVDFYIEEMLS